MFKKLWDFCGWNHFFDLHTSGSCHTLVCNHTHRNIHIQPNVSNMHDTENYGVHWPINWYKLLEIFIFRVLEIIMHRVLTKNYSISKYNTSKLWPIWNPNLSKNNRLFNQFIRLKLPAIQKSVQKISTVMTDFVGERCNMDFFWNLKKIHEFLKKLR